MPQRRVDGRSRYAALLTRAGSATYSLSRADAKIRVFPKTCPPLARGVREQHTGVKLSVWGQNLTNRHVISGVFLLNQADGVNYGPPRTFGATVEYAF